MSRTHPTITAIVAPSAADPSGLAGDGAATVHVVRTAAELDTVIGDTDVLAVYDFRTELVARLGSRAGELDWIHAASAGVDAVLTPAVVAGPTRVTNAQGVFDDAIAEYVLAVLLVFAKDLRTTLALQQQHTWHHRETERLAGRQVVVVGAGSIGRSISRLCRAAGMSVRGVARQSRSDDPDFDAVVGVDQLHPELATADDVVLATPLTADTHRLIDRGALAAMRPGARLVNIGRGPVVDHDALLDALRSGQVGAVALDVFDHENRLTAHVRRRRRLDRRSRRPVPRQPRSMAGRGAAAAHRRQARTVRSPVMTESTAIEWMDATELLDAYAAGTLSPLEVTDHLLDRIERLDGPINAWCHLDPETTRDQARQSTERWEAGTPQGRLDGVPVAVKDVFLTEGWPTRKGSATVDVDQPWTDDSPSVAALRRNGAVLLGKTTTPELGWKGVTDAPATGITRNPWNTDLTPGGSSGGSSAALVAGMVPLALGTDGGGSIRIPAAFSGCTGIKPTWGRVPHWPVSPYGGLAHAGPMSRTVADTALLLDVLVEADHRDTGALMPDGVDHLAALGQGIRGLRIAYSPTLGYVDVHPEVAAAVRTAVEALEALGAHVEEVDPGFDDPIGAFRVLWNSGAAQATKTDSAADRARRDPGLQAICDDGARYSAVDYIDALAVRGEVAVTMGRFHQSHDLLVTPTLPVPAFEAGRNVPVGWPDEHWPSWATFMYPFNITQQPGASVPCGFTADGLPIGVQLVGPRGADALVLRTAHAYETTRPGVTRRPPLTEEH